MSKQTAHFKNMIESAEQGNHGSINFCRGVIEVTAKNPNTPDEVIIEISKLILQHGIEEGRKNAEAN